MSEEKVVSAVKLDLYWVSFKDSAGRTHNRMILRNPDDRMLLWDFGIDRPTNMPSMDPPFEEREKLNSEKLSDQTISTCPKWLEDAITEATKTGDRYYDTSTPPAFSEDVRNLAEKALRIRPGSVEANPVVPPKKKRTRGGK